MANNSGNFSEGASHSANSDSGPLGAREAAAAAAEAAPAAGALPEGAFETLEEALRTAGGILTEYRGRIRKIEYKSEINLVTDADHAAEKAILSIIRGRFPGHSILAEESGALAESGASGATGAKDAAKWRWVIDPLDGTTNYAHGLAIFSVSIALQRNETTVAGGVFAPALGEIFLARRGGGATMNGAPIRVSDVASLERALVVSGFPYDRRERVEYYMEIFGRVLARTQGVIRWGSAAIDLCMVACGRLEAFWEQNLHPWDTAAGELIVCEAGGRVTRFDGSPYSIFDKQILATNGRVHEAMQALMPRI